MASLGEITRMPCSEQAFQLDEMSARFASRYDVSGSRMPRLRTYTGAPPLSQDHETWFLRADLSLPVGHTGPVERGEPVFEGSALYRADGGGLVYASEWRDSVVGTDLSRGRSWLIHTLGGYLILRFHDALARKLDLEAQNQMGVLPVPGMRGGQPRHDPSVWEKVDEVFCLMGDAFSADLQNWLAQSDFAQEASQAVFGAPASSGPWFSKKLFMSLGAWADKIPHFTRCARAAVQRSGSNS